MRFTPVFVPLCVALTALGGCAFIIPPEENAPRHNTVLGAPRRPQLNLNLAPQSALPARADVVAANNAAPAIPSVDPAVAAQAQREIAAVDAASQAVVASALPAPGADGLGERRVPVENAQFQVAGNYPALDSVPPRPQLTGPDSAAARLSATNADLERDRASANANADALARDAAAEPSLLNQVPPASALPPALVPSPSEIRRPPNDNGASAAPAAAPSPVTVRTALPASAAFAPPPPNGNLARVEVAPPPAVRAVNAPAPVVAGARAPIILRPPVETVAAVPPPVTLSIPAPAQRTGPNVKPGDFDPLATADNAPVASRTPLPDINAVVSPSYANNRYLAPSRYYERR